MNIIQNIKFNSKSRTEKMLNDIDRHQNGLEIGASFNPTLKREDGFDIEFLDHLSKDDLIAKYKDNPTVDTSKIGSVDYVWSGEKYSDLTKKQYGYILASHVVEHVPDLVAFLNNCSGILKDDGVLSLAVPNKVNCFDYFRPLSGLREVIDANVARRIQPTLGSVCELEMMNAKCSGKHAWAYRHFLQDVTMETTNSIDKSYLADQLERISLGYVDTHVWCFVPSSFRLIMQQLYRLGLTDLREISYHPGIESEFFISLGRSGSGSGLSDEALASRAIKEQARSLSGLGLEILSAAVARFRASWNPQSR